MLEKVTGARIRACQLSCSQGGNLSLNTASEEKNRKKKKKKVEESVFRRVENGCKDVCGGKIPVSQNSSPWNGPVGISPQPGLASSAPLTFSRFN